MKKLFIIIILILFIFSYQDSYAQITYTFPVGQNNPGDVRSREDMSSAFGPRNLSDDDEYPNSFYDYDFHAGIDIPAPKDYKVYAVYKGRVTNKGHDLNFCQWIEIRSPTGRTDQPYFWVRYFHIIPLAGIEINTDIPTTGQQIGTIGDYDADNQTNNDHLHIASCPTESWNYGNGVNINSQNPGILLGGGDITNFYTNPRILDNLGVDITNISASLMLESDPVTEFGNRANKKYFEISVTVLQNELDLDAVHVWLSGTDNGTSYNTYSLLDQSDVNPPGGRYAGEVDYAFKLNCGDWTGSNTDIGHNSYQLGIIPVIFHSDHVNPQGKIQMVYK
jgi:hypothetical protein